MWLESVNRQYNLFGNILMFLITAVSIISVLLVGTNHETPFLVKVLFSIVSAALSLSIYGLMKMAQIEREISFKINPPPSADCELQTKENIWRDIVYKLINLSVLLTLVLVNIILWLR